MNRTFVIGDIHGAFRALMQCFEKTGFNYKNDTLICLGDVCDGWSEVNLVIDELLKVSHLVYILGNHDEWALKWFLHGEAPAIWISQGGDATMNSYKGKIPENHIQLLESAKFYYEENNKLFVHAGFNPAENIEIQGSEILIWDRNLVYNAIDAAQEGKEKLTSYNEVYVGHTPTINFGYNEPVRRYGFRKCHIRSRCDT